MNDQSFTSYREKRRTWNFLVNAIPVLNECLSTLPPEFRSKSVKPVTESNSEHVAVKTDYDDQAPPKVEQCSLDSNPENPMPISDDSPNNRSNDGSNDDPNDGSNDDSNDDSNDGSNDGSNDDSNDDFNDDSNDVSNGGSYDDPDDSSSNGSSRDKWGPFKSLEFEWPSINISANRSISDILEDYCSGRKAKHVLAQFYRLNSNDRTNVRFKLINLIRKWNLHGDYCITDSQIFQFLDGFSVAVSLRNRDQLESLISSLEDFQSNTASLKERCERMARKPDQNLEPIKRSVEDNMEEFCRVTKALDKAAEILSHIQRNIKAAQNAFFEEFVVKRPRYN